MYMYMTTSNHSKVNIVFFNLCMQCLQRAIPLHSHVGLQCVQGFTPAAHCITHINYKYMYLWNIFNIKKNVYLSHRSFKPIYFIFPCNKFTTRPGKITKVNITCTHTGTHQWYSESNYKFMLTSQSIYFLQLSCVQWQLTIWKMLFPTAAVRHVANHVHEQSALLPQSSSCQTYHIPL